ncbi:hypothetical protein [Agrobacterium tumefaciens]|uniref:hypothetical protein n=1 Tax=Agrobacterium tumefaciens TaxID=358 RepID=UPI000DDB9338|nr:hypothetical protein [Agrobacterium tumefaciens]
MVTVKNLTNSPYDLQGKDGLVRLPAFGEVEGEFEPDYLALLEASMAVKVESGEQKPSKVVDDDDKLSTLRSEYQDLYGKRAYHGWSAEELQEKIDAKLAE